MRQVFQILVVFITLVMVGCTTPEEPVILVSVVANGRELSFRYTEPITVEQFLAEAEIEFDPATDRVNPQLWTQIFDGIRITIVHVEEDEYCEDVTIPFERQIRPSENLDPGEEQPASAGKNGIEEICYRVHIENGIPGEPAEIRRTIIEEAKPEIVFVGPSEEVEPVPVQGTLAYINNGNAWIIRGSSTRKRPLTFSGDLDNRVLSLSPDGRNLLIARETDTDTAFGNQLWLINDTISDSTRPVSLIPQDVLYAEWVPERENTISYSTAEPRQAAPGWNALNDLWIMRIDTETGEQININEVLGGGTNGGLYSWWGRQYEWSPNGDRLAWIHADSIGLIDLEEKELEDPLVTYPVVDPQLGNWSWRTRVSWSFDNDYLLTTVHGQPVGAESPENSFVFDVSVVAVDGSLVAELVPRAGIWSIPEYSPQVINDNSQFPKGYIAYLRAREWENNRNGDYDLVVADRDGSNARIIFPPSPQQPGLSAQVGELAWSPDGRQIAFIYLGNVWIVDVESGVAHQLTVDGGASRPVWTR